ncbi:hypothetical protein ASL14_05425 [Paenibacillus sp. IHB B 3084]|nr:hypothetical protein ASL14_05425 [Paenibacillus sp. IHB B 3084]
MSTTTVKKLLVHTYLLLFTMPIVGMIIWYFLSATFNSTTGQFSLENFNLSKNLSSMRGLTCRRFGLLF